jgi:hypothetical protein
MQEGRSNGSELSFHRMVVKDYQHLFPDLVSRSRYHRGMKSPQGISGIFSPFWRDIPLPPRSRALKKKEWISAS